MALTAAQMQEQKKQAEELLVLGKLKHGLRQGACSSANSRRRSLFPYPS